MLILLTAVIAACTDLGPEVDAVESDIDRNWPRETLSGVWGTGGNNVFVVGTAGTILNYNGTNWELMQSNSTRSLNGIWGSAQDNILVAISGASQGSVLHYNGQEWKEIVDGKPPLFRIWGSSGDNVFALGSGGTILHYDGEEWADMYSPTSNGLYGIWGTSGTNILAVGVLGTMLRFDGEDWRELTNYTTQNLFDVWGSRDEIFIVGGYGTVLQP